MCPLIRMKCDRDNEIIRDGIPKEMNFLVEKQSGILYSSLLLIYFPLVLTSFPIFEPIRHFIPHHNIENS